ncbi:MAG: type I restriction endonuclease subunit R, partial [Sulfurimonas sp.]
ITYNDIRDWQRLQKFANEKETSTIDWDDVVFEVDLLKSQEINLDYILELIFDHNKKTKDKVALVEEVRRLIRSSLGNRAKESLLNPQYLTKKQSVFQKIAAFVEKFKGMGGQI